MTNAASQMLKAPWNTDENTALPGSHYKQDYRHDQNPKSVLQKFVPAKRQMGDDSNGIMTHSRVMGGSSPISPV